MSIDQQLVVEPQLKSPLCMNCDRPLSGKYCAECGQPDRPLDPSFHDLWHEGIHEFLHLDGKILTTLKVLLSRPGKLTLDYYAGRRARYIGPIRLYLTVSLVFFLIAAYASKKPDPAVLDQIADASKKQGAVVLDQGGRDEIVVKTDDEARAGAITNWLSGALKKTAHDPERFKHAFLTNVSRVMFVMVPLFALGLRIAYGNRGRKYPGFLYFSLHYHSLVFLALIASDLVGLTHINALTNWTDGALKIWCLVYLFMALRRVFGGTWRTTAIRIGALGIVYLPCVVIGVAAAAAISLFAL